MSLKTKFILATVVVNIAVLALLTVTIIVQGVKRNRALQQEKAEFAARQLQDWLQQNEQFYRRPDRKPTGQQKGSNAYYVQKLISRLRTSELFQDWVLLDRNLNVLESERTNVQFSQHQQNQLKQVVENRSILVENNRVYFPIIRGDNKLYTVTTNLKPFTASLPTIYSVVIPTALIMGLGTILLGAVLYVIYDRLLLSPLENLVEATRSISRGDQPEELELPDRNDEIKNVFKAFNQMAGELESYRTQMEEQVKKTREKMERTRNKLVIAQRLSSMGTLASGIAHEINNPLGGMINAVKSLKSSGESPEKRREYLELIDDGLERIRKIVQRVLEFAPNKDQEVEVEELSVQETLEKVLRLEQYRLSSSDIEVETNFPEEDVSIRGAAAELQQAFLNILKNAIDACQESSSPDPSRITISVQLHEKDRVTISFSDTGPGLSEEEQDKAFDPFYTTKEGKKGSGLGLSITHQIIQNHGGTIEIDTEPREGTSVVVTLPLNPEEPGLLTRTTDEFLDEEHYE